MRGVRFAGGGGPELASDFPSLFGVTPRDCIGLTILLAPARPASLDHGAQRTGFVGPAIAAESDFPGSSSLHPATGATIRRLAVLDIDVLAPMHAPAFTGNCRGALEHLAADYDERVAAFEQHP